MGFLKKKQLQATNFNTEGDLRHRNYIPKTKLAGSGKLSSEFLGTILLIGMIGLLGVTFSGTKFEILLSGHHNNYVLPFVIGLGVGLDILLCLLIFSRGSSDLNPAITLYRIISGGDNGKWGLTKIAVQFVASIVAGFCIVSTQQIAFLVSNNPLDMITNKANTGSAFRANVAVVNEQIAADSFSRYGLALLGELVGTALLIGAVFSNGIKNHVLKDAIIIGTIVFALPAFVPLGTLGGNPARTLGTNVVYDLFKGGTNAIRIAPVYIVAEFAAPFLVLALQKLFDRYLQKGGNKAVDLFKIKE